MRDAWERAMASRKTGTKELRYDGKAPASGTQWHADRGLEDANFSGVPPGTQFYVDTNGNLVRAYAHKTDGIPHTDPWGPNQQQTCDATAVGVGNAVEDYTVPTGSEAVITYVAAHQDSGGALDMRIQVDFGGAGNFLEIYSENTETLVWPNGDAANLAAPLYLKAGDILRVQTDAPGAGNGFDFGVIGYRERKV